MWFKSSFFRVLPLIYVALICMIPRDGLGAKTKVVTEKQVEVAMRLIGHEVLLCMGDETSRVLPIERLNQHDQNMSYRISFELEFGFDPADIVSIVEEVMTATAIATHYLVEIEHQSTKEVVHAFEIKSDNSDITACQGRILPEDRYSLVVTLFDRISPEQHVAGLNGANFWKSTITVVLILFLIGLGGFFLIRSNRVPDPNLAIIGASQFDKKNKQLVFEDQSIPLSHKESELLALLLSSANTPIKREVLLHEVWGDDGDYVGRTLDVFISKLRKKLEADAMVKIVNIRGVGYKLVV